jgi:hypothetical protein
MPCIVCDNGTGFVKVRTTILLLDSHCPRLHAFMITPLDTIAIDHAMGMISRAGGLCRRELPSVHFPIYGRSTNLTR